ncbi:hypothetical protein FDJ58_gp023 [Bacillus phage SIOphi]|uniref:Uncharacterized protein n=2 Tax=root TaxID=1 RepID=R4JGG9_9CAUD|nr:hypothetical protein [Streptococcus lutetiensis]YP_009625673.1 hypothetical protein FDJ58_gp023 [Bacillus phage SIOphi]AGK86831.1 hypothetical protein SIOphi_00115 [Bacillus phage SIOphi]QXN69836.1 hypothetical protein MAWWA_25 [Bacillus phage vB_BspH_Mawwa]QXN70645.1 hypothetical protein TIMEGRIFFIN_26 [Bacillus phage vB_BspH_TimeGriffin]
MARKKTLEITMVDGSKWFVLDSQLDVGGIPDNPVSLIASYIRGSRGTLLGVTSTAGGPDEGVYVNPELIVSLKVTYD